MKGLCKWVRMELPVLKDLFPLRRFSSFCLKIDDVTSGLFISKNIHHKIKNISRSHSNLAPVMYARKDTKWHPMCCYYGNSFRARFTFPVFVLIKHYDEPVSRCKVIWASRVFQVWPSVTPHLVKTGDSWFLANKTWSLDCCHGNIIGIILYLTWGILPVPSLNDISEIFPQILLILWFIFLLKLFVMSSVFKQKVE